MSEPKKPQLPQISKPGHEPEKPKQPSGGLSKLPPPFESTPAVEKTASIPSLPPALGRISKPESPPIPKLGAISSAASHGVAQPKRPGSGSLPSVSGVVRAEAGAISEKATQIEIPTISDDMAMSKAQAEEAISERKTNLELDIVSDSDLDELFGALIREAAKPQVDSDGAFSVPQAGAGGAPVVESRSADFGFEAALNMPEELRAAIMEYDEEIKASKPGGSVNVAAIHMAVARLLDHAGYEKQVYTRMLKALERNPMSIAALRELRRIARAYGNWSDVGVLLDSELKIPASEQRKASLLEESARLRRFLPEWQSSVTQSLKKAVALFPDKVSPREVLLMESAIQGDWALFMETLAAMANLVKDPRNQAGYYICQALALQFKLDDSLGATSQYLQALSVYPGSLSSLLAVLPLLYAQERWDVCFKVLQQFTQSCEDKGINFALYFLLASLGDEKLEKSQAAIETLEKAVQISGGNELALEILRELYERNRSYWRDLDATYQRLIAVQLEPALKVELSVLRAEARIKYGEDYQGGIEILRMAYDEMPRSRVLLEKLCAILREHGQLENYAHYENILAEQSEGMLAADRYATLGLRIWESAGPETEYIQCFERAMQCNPNHGSAFESLERIFREKGRYSDLIRIYEQKLAVTRSLPKRAAVHKSMAVIYEYQLNHAQLAIESLREYRKIYPDDLEAILSLERLFVSIRHWPLLLETCLEELRLSKDKVERSDILLRMADICQNRLGRENECISFLQLALKEQADQLSICERLASKLRAQKRSAELYVLLESMLRLVDASQKTLVLCEMAEISHTDLDKREQAISHYREALKLEPTQNRAFYGLCDLYKESASWSEYVELILQRAEHGQSVRGRVSILYRVAIKYVFSLQMLPEAERLLLKARELDPTFLPAALLLDLVLGLRSQWEGLCQSLENTLSIDMRPQSKAELSFRLAALYTWRHETPEAAAQPLELALALVNDLPAARLQLIYDNFKREQLRDIAALYFEAAQTCHDKNLSIALCRSAADMAHCELKGAPDDDTHVEELSALRRMLELDPFDPVAVERLESMTPKRAQLLPYWEKRLPGAQGDEAVELKLSIAEVLFADNPQKAFNLLCEAVEASPQHMPAVRMAANTALKLNNYMLACRYRAEEGKRLENIDNKIKAYQEAASIASKMLNRSDIAIHNLRQAFLIAPQNRAICDELLGLYEIQRDWNNMNNTLAIHSNYISGGDKIERYMQMANIYLNSMNEPQQAIVKLRQLLEIEHDNIPALEMLARLEISLQHWSEARYAYLALLEDPRMTPQKRREYRLLLAPILSKHLAKAKQAAALLLAQVEEDPGDVQTLHQLGALYAEEGEYQSSLKIYQKLNEIIKAPQNAEVLLRMATIYRNLNEVDKLNQTMAGAAQLVPLDPGVLDSLEQWFLQCEDLSVILAFVQELLKLSKLENNTMVKIYTFVFKCYSGPLHMRFEADKFALAAANLAPKNIQAQLLAARVFDPKEAFTHAFTAMTLDPNHPDVYRTIYNIAETAHRMDLQARAEQTLIALGDTARRESPLQNAFTMRYPEKHTSPSAEQLARLAPENIDRWALELLRKAGLQAQIFAISALPSEPIHPNSRFANILKAISDSLGLETPNAHFGPLEHVFSLKHDAPEILVFNRNLIELGSEAEQRFHIASALYSLKIGSILLRILETKDIFRLLNGLLGLAYDQYGEPDIVKRLNSFLSRKDRKAVIEHVKSVPIDQIQIEAQDLQLASFLAENRVGLLYCADLDAAMTGLMRIHNQGANPSTDPHQRALQIPHMQGAQDLLVFNLSYTFEDLRKELGMALRPEI